MGRFLETDPIRYRDGVNWYGYVGNNPVNRVDSSGLDFTIVHGVPSSAVPYQAPNGQSFYAPPYADYQAVLAAGKANGMVNIGGINNAIGQYGTYDFQRIDAGVMGQSFYPACTNAANYAVGVFMYGAGYSLAQMQVIRSTYAALNSSNAGASSQADWWANGWNAANNRNVNGNGPSGNTCTSCPCQ